MNLIPSLLWLLKAFTHNHLNILEWLKEGFSDPKRYKVGKTTWFHY